MSSSSNDPATDQTGRFVRQPNGRVRPLSPHLQVWRWHVTMLGSILHRITGGALAVGAVLVGLWLAALASGPDAYAAFTGCMGSPFGLFIWFGLTVALGYHLASGVRHLIWDSGEGLSVSSANRLTMLTLVVGVILAIGFWMVLLASGKVVL